MVLVACSPDSPSTPPPFEAPIVLPPRDDPGARDATAPAKSDVAPTPGEPPQVGVTARKTSWSWTVRGAGSAGELQVHDLTTGDWLAPPWSTLASRGFSYEPTTDTFTTSESFDRRPASERGHDIEVTVRAPETGKTAGVRTTLPPIPTVRATYTPGARVVVSVSGAETRLQVLKKGPNVAAPAWADYAPGEWTYDASADVYTLDQPKSGYCAGFQSPYGWIMSYELSFRNGAYPTVTPPYVLAVQVACP